MEGGGDSRQEGFFLDAMGWNMPNTVRETILAIRETYPDIETFHMHLHNTRGATIASYYEALNLGATEFDTSLGGMGGYPYCGNGRAAGHVPTEDFVHMCHEMGIETGYNLDKVIEAACIAEEIVGHAPKAMFPKLAPILTANVPTLPTCRLRNFGRSVSLQKRPASLRRTAIALA